MYVYVHIKKPLLMQEVRGSTPRLGGLGVSPSRFCFSLGIFLVISKKLLRFGLFLGNFLVFSKKLPRFVFFLSNFLVFSKKLPRFG